MPRTSVVVAGIVCVLLSGQSLAQFAPEGATAKPDNPSVAERTTPGPIHGLFRLVSTYYFDCLKRKWVLASYQWQQKSKSSDDFNPIPAPVGEEDTRPPATLDSGPPPGYETDPTAPDHASNPTTGAKAVLHKNKWNIAEWVDEKTGAIVLVPKLCPDPTAVPYEEPPPPPLDLKQPHVPADFCSEKERDAWIAKYLDPTLQRAQAQVNEWQQYVADIQSLKYSGRAEQVAAAEANQERAEQFLAVVQGLYDDAHKAKIKNCGLHIPFDIGVGVGIGGHGHAGAQQQPTDKPSPSDSPDH